MLFLTEHVQLRKKMIYDFLQQVYFEFETKVIYSFFTTMMLIVEMIMVAPF